LPYIGNPIYQSAFVTDSFSGTGSQTAYTMSVAPAGTTNVLVVVSGVVQDPSTYGVVGNTLNFTTAPPSGTGNISCRYLGVPVTGVTTTAYRTLTEFTATSGQTTFTPPSYTVGYILVFRNGVLLGSADYTASNGTTVVLTTGATAGDLITTESFYISSVLNAIPNTAGSVSNSNLAALSTLPVSGGTITLPQVTGTAMVSGNMPAFSSLMQSNQTVTANTLTLVQFNQTASANTFDTASAFNTSTYAYTPKVAGYYQVTGSITGPSVTTGAVAGFLYKNGSNIQQLSQVPNVTGSGIATGSYIIYLNGLTDYIQIYVYCTTTGGTIYSGQSGSYFQAVLVRAA